jgi:hypothetical protein
LAFSFAANSCLTLRLNWTVCAAALKQNAVLTTQMEAAIARGENLD